MKHWRDRTGELDKYVRYWLKNEPMFRPLLVHKVKILTCFRDEHEMDKDGMAVFGKTSKLGSKARDLYGYDFMLTFAFDLWQASTRVQKKRVVWHELYHCGLITDDEGAPKTDAEGRTCLYIQPHDVVVKSFQDEIEKFGLESHEVSAAVFLRRAYKEHKARARDG
jgi:hypothetical protein